MKKISNLPNFAMNHREMNEKNTKYNHLAIRCYKRVVLKKSQVLMLFGTCSGIVRACSADCSGCVRVCSGLFGLAFFIDFCVIFYVVFVFI